MNKLSKILIGVCLCLLVIIFALLTKLRINSKEEDIYDISMMHSVDVTDVLDMFDTKDTYVVFIGRDSCETCEHILDTLKENQVENNYITQYLDITSIDFSADEFSSLIEKLNKKTTYKLSDDSEEETNTFGYFLKNYGLTPMLFIIKNGKLVNGYIGNTDKEVIKNLINNEIK